MNIILTKSLSKFMALSFLLGLMVFNPGLSGGAPDKADSLSSSNQQITLLYIDALNFYKEAKFNESIDSVSKIKDLLKSEPYVSSVRKSLEIQPTEAALDEFAQKLKKKQDDLDSAKGMLKSGDYVKAKDAFEVLLKDSPESKEIKDLIKSSQDLRSKAVLKQQQDKKAEELAKQKQQREAQKQEELSAKKAREEKIRQEAELKKQAELEKRRARAEELAKQKQEMEAARQKEIQQQQEARLAKLKDIETQREQERLKLAKENEQRQAELQARQAQMAKEKDEESKKIAQENAQRRGDFEKQRIEIIEKENKIKQELAAKKDIEDQENDLARKTKLMELQRQKDEELRKVAAEKEKKQKELALKQQQYDAYKRDQDLKKKQETEEKQKKADELKQKKALELQAKKDAQASSAEEPKPRQPEMSGNRSNVQDKALAEAKINKKKEDQKKIEKADRLWNEARALYQKGMYEEAIKEFQEIIQIEGNPRIKYTPYAKDYIDKANQKLESLKAEALSKGVDDVEKDMLKEVSKQQIPPYVEPPEKTEVVEESPLVEPPLIRKKLKKKISLDFDKVDLKSVISFLSQETGVNFVASQKVLDMSPKITIRFSDAPVAEVIKYMTKSQGLIYRIDKEIVWIAHPEEIAQEPLETRLYYLSKGGGLFTDFAPVGSSSDTSLGGSSSSINKIYTIADTLKEVVPWPQDAKLTYDKRLNALIVRNTPQNLQMLEDIIYSLDITPCQVLIEARFMEVDVTDTKELGLTWNLNADFPTKTENGQLQQGILKDSGVKFSDFVNAAEGFNLSYAGVLTNPQFQTVLHAFDQNKKIKTLSSPRIMTLNNQLATIKVVDEWIYPTRYEFEIVQFDLNGDGNFNGPGETQFKNVPKDFLRRDVGILLKVIPAVGADKKTISLSLIPEVSEAVADGFVYTGDVRLPKFTSRNLSTTVVVTSGDTVVLGGLIKENRTKTLTKVPILGDMPLLGGFFRKNEDSIERKNLLIFVTAKVITASGEEVVTTSK